MENQKNKNKWVMAAVAFGMFAACGAIYAFFPSGTNAALKNTSAMIVESWRQVFGVSSGGYVASEIAFEGDQASDTLVLDDEHATSAQEVFEKFEKIDLPAKSTSKATAKITTPATTTKKVATIAPAPTSTPQKVVTSTTSAKSTTTIKVSPSVTATPASTSATTTATSATENIPEEIPLPSCTIATSTTPSRKIILSEIAWMGSSPSASETATQASNREWMELKNISGSAIDISRWQIIDAAGNLNVAFAAGNSISPNIFYLLERGESALPDLTADAIYSGGLSNGGNVVAIVDHDCSVVDFIDASSGWPAGDNSSKQTLERDLEGFGWHTSVVPGGTPKAENSIIVVIPPVSTSTPTSTPTSTEIIIPPAPPTSTVSSTTTNHILIVEIQIAGASSANDFVKLFNPTGDAVDIGGWKLRKKSSTGTDGSLREFPTGSSMASGSYFIWANASNGFGDSIDANVTSTGTLAADNSVAILNADGMMVDAIAWGTGTDQYGETEAHPTNPSANETLRRKFVENVFIDTDHNANDFELSAMLQ